MGSKCKVAPIQCCNKLRGVALRSHVKKELFPYQTFIYDKLLLSAMTSSAASCHALQSISNVHARIFLISMRRRILLQNVQHSISYRHTIHVYTFICTIMVHKLRSRTIRSCYSILRTAVLTTITLSFSRQVTYNITCAPIQSI